MEKILLTEGRLEKLIEKLRVLPIHKWNREERNDNYDPPSWNYFAVSSKTNYINYTTLLNNFKFIINKEDHDGYNSYRYYYLRIFLKEDLNKEKCLDEELNIYKDKSKGNIQRLYEEINLKYKDREKQFLRKNKNKTLKAFNQIIK